MAYPTESPKGSYGPVTFSGAFSTEPNPFLSTLLDSLGKNVRDRYYKGKTVYLDGYTFANCCFHNCNLITETGVFTFDACTMASSTVIFGEHAIRLIKLYNLLDRANPNQANFLAQVGADGAVSIR